MNTQISKHIKYAAFVLVFSVLLYLLVLIRYSQLLPFRPVPFLLCVCLSIAALFCHIGQQKKLNCDNYAAYVLTGAGASKHHIPYLDYLRIIAVVFVLCVHTIGSTAAAMVPHSAQWISITLPGVLFHSCNLLFMMLSGALLLNGKDEPLHVFYLRRGCRVLIPAFLYFLFYRIITMNMPVFSLDQWRTTFADFFTGTDSVPPHYWLIYVILAFYLTAPFFRVMLRNMSDHALASMALMILIMQTLYTYLPVFGLPLPFLSFLFTFESIFLWGYFLSRPSSDRYYKPILTGGLLSLLISWIILRTRDDYLTLLYNNAPTLLLISGAIFMLVKKNAGRLPQRLPAFLAVISKYSFSILLIHWFVLFNVVEGKLHLNGQTFGIIPGTTATVFVTLIGCIVFSIVFDNTVVICVQTAVDRVLKRVLTDNNS